MKWLLGEDGRIEKRKAWLLGGATVLLLVAAFVLMYWFNRSPVALFRSDILSLVADIQPKYLFSLGSDSMADSENLLNPATVAADAQGRIYVTDTGHNKVRVYDHSGKHLFDIGQPGKGDGQFLSPRGLAISGDKLYVSDSDIKKVEVFGLDGQYRETLVISGQKPEGIGNINPLGLAVDKEGNLYICDIYGSRVVVLDGAGNLKREFGESGNGPVSLSYANYLAVGRDGKVYVADSNHALVKVFDREGELLFTFNGREQNQDNPIDVAANPEAAEEQEKAISGSLLTLPRGIAIDEQGRIMVVDVITHSLRIFEEDGTPKMAYGSQGIGEGEFNFPNGLAVAGDRIYVADKGNNRVVVLQR